MPPNSKNLHNLREVSPSRASPCFCPCFPLSPHPECSPPPPPPNITNIVGMPLTRIGSFQNSDKYDDIMNIDCVICSFTCTQMAIMQGTLRYDLTLTWCRNTRTIRSWSVGNHSCLSQASEKSFCG